MKRWYTFVPPSILSALTIAVYYNSLRSPFLFDDLPSIVNNYAVHSFSASHLMFSTSRWVSQLLNLFTLNTWGLTPFPFRVINLSLHIATGLLVFTLTLLLSKQHRSLQKYPLLIATIVSGLFLLHPVQTQTATYITQMRLEGVATFFAMGIILLFVLAIQSKKRYLTITLLSSTLVLTPFAAGTKEIIVVLPLLLMLVDWFFLAQGDYKPFLKRLPFHLCLAFILYYVYLKSGSPVKPADVIGLKYSLKNNRGNILTPKAGELITPLTYLVGQFRVILHYITIFFWPTGITFDYGWKITRSFFAPVNLLPFTLLIGILTTGLVLFIKDMSNLVSFSIAWFFIVILPRSSIIPSTELVCDYKTYLASFGIFLLMAHGIVRLASLHHKMRWVAPVFLFCILSVASHTRNKVWGSRLAFWKDVIDKTAPHASARAYNNYAVGLENVGDKAGAFTQYKNAIKIDPTYAEPVINVALHYQLKRDFKNALKHYNHAIRLKEQHPEMFNNLGLLHFTRHEYNKAKPCFLRAIKFRKHYSKALFNLGRTHQMLKEFDKALSCYKKAIHGNTRELNHYYMYGALSCQLKQYKQALPFLEYVVASNKNFKNTLFLLATCYYGDGQAKKALPHFQFVYQKEKSATARYNYAQALLQTKEYQKALPLFTACKNNKRLPHAALHSAKCLHHIGQTNKAVEELKRFIQATNIPRLQQMGVQLLSEIRA